MVTDPSGVQTTNTYDSNGNLTQSSRPLVGSSPAQSQTVAYTYGDAQHPGDLTQMTDADGKLWHYAYDSHGYRSSETDPLGDQTTYSKPGSDIEFLYDAIPSKNQCEQIIVVKTVVNRARA